MAFLIKKPFILIIISIICVVIIIVLSSKSPLVISPSLANSSIIMNTNTTLTTVIKNSGTRLHSVEYRIVGTFKSDQLIFYDKINGALLNSTWTGKNNTIIFPRTRELNIGEEWSVSVFIKGLDPGGDFAKYTIFLEVYADHALSARKSVQLTVRRV